MIACKLLALRIPTTQKRHLIRCLPDILFLIPIPLEVAIVS